MTLVAGLALTLVVALATLGPLWALLWWQGHPYPPQAPKVAPAGAQGRDELLRAKLRAMSDEELDRLLRMTLRPVEGVAEGYEAIEGWREYTRRLWRAEAPHHRPLDSRPIRPYREPPPRSDDAA